MKINNMEKKGERWTNRTTGAGGNKTEKLKLISVPRDVRYFIH